MYCHSLAVEVGHLLSLLYEQPPRRLPVQISREKLLRQNINETYFKPLKCDRVMFQTHLGLKLCDLFVVVGETLRVRA
jgi:hypothetical protein